MNGYPILAFVCTLIIAAAIEGKPDLTMGILTFIGGAWVVYLTTRDEKP